MNQLTRATLLGTLAQLVMVVAGHYLPAIANLFAIGGMGISALAGWGALKGQSETLAGAAGGGALAGGICAAIGIGASVLMGDVPASLLGFGTISSAVTGMIGGVIGRQRG
jgi:hypothetical protein